MKIANNPIDLIVIGAGAAGMLAAASAAQGGANVLLLERNERFGWKLSLTGKGRCNVTNACPPQQVIDSTVTNGRFLYKAVQQFPPAQVMEFFTQQGVPLKTERGNRVFPVSDRAMDIVDALHGFLRTSGVKTAIHSRVQALLIEDGVLQGVKTEDGKRYYAPNVLIACGGVSYPATGSTGDGYRLARQVGHRIVPVRASLVPLVTGTQECRDMQGLSLKNTGLTVVDTVKNKTVYTDFGELLFTHFGLSGPIVLSASAHMPDPQPGKYRIELDLKPALTAEKLDERLLREFAQNKNKFYANMLGSLLPAKMISVFAKRTAIPADTPCNSITRAQRQKIIQTLKCFTLPVQGFRPVEEAIVTGGGVDVKEVDPKTMQSKKLAGLYFAGEVLDLDAYTGGFNLQIAFCTAHLAAQSVLQALQRTNTETGKAENTN